MQDKSKRESKWLHRKVIINILPLILSKISIFLFIILNVVHCFGLLRPNYLTNSEIVDALEKDKLFLLTNGNFFLDDKAENFDLNLRLYKKTTGESERNFYALYSTRNSLIEDAEKEWVSLIDKYNNSSYLLNYIRLKYLVDDYDGLRIFLREYFTKNISNIDQLNSISNLLKQFGRVEENTIYIGVLSEFSTFEKKANLELGEYFFQSGDYANAKIYFEKILNSYSYDLKALDALVTISVYEENWQNAILYGKILRKEKYRNKDYYLNLIKSYYELENYSELISFISEIPEADKKDKQIIIYWRNSILSLDPSKSTKGLRKYLPQNTQDNRDLDLEFSLSDEGMSIYKRIFKGY